MKVQDRARPIGGFYTLLESGAGVGLGPSVSPWRRMGRVGRQGRCARHCSLPSVSASEPANQAAASRSAVRTRPRCGPGPPCESGRAVDSASVRTRSALRERPGCGLGLDVARSAVAVLPAAKACAGSTPTSTVVQAQMCASRCRADGLASPLGPVGGTDAQKPAHEQAAHEQVLCRNDSSAWQASEPHQRLRD
jgi:hypothetical protein